MKSCVSESTVSPAAVTNEYSTHPVQGDSVGCPPSYESYCLHGGVCNYVSDLQDYACKYVQKSVLPVLMNGILRAQSQTVRCLSRSYLLITHSIYNYH